MTSILKFFHHVFNMKCRNPNIGLMTKARACKGAGQEGNLGVTFHAPRSVKDCVGVRVVGIWRLLK